MFDSRQGYQQKNVQVGMFRKALGSRLVAFDSHIDSHMLETAPCLRSHSLVEDSPIMGVAQLESLGGVDLSVTERRQRHALPTRGVCLGMLLIVTMCPESKIPGLFASLSFV